MVHDCAYVGYELRRGLANSGIKVQHLFFNGPPKLATLKMAINLRKTKWDLIHAHYCRSAAYASYASGKPFIVHCHGGDVRWGINWLQRKCLKKAKKVLVSTPDLLGTLPDAVWLPNPIDTQRFKPLKKHNENKVLYYPHWYENITIKLTELCNKLGYTLTIPRSMSVPYEKMHIFLNNFDIFIDRFSIKSYSKTALEAVACGLAVVGFNHDLENSLKNLVSYRLREKLVKQQNESILPKHNIGNVTKKLIQIYGQLEDTQLA